MEIELDILKEYKQSDIVDMVVLSTGAGLTQIEVWKRKRELISLGYMLVKVIVYEMQHRVDYTLIKVKPVNIESKIVSIVKHKAIIENLTYGKVYNVLLFDKKNNCYNIIDDSGKYSSYHKDYFLSLSKWEEYFPNKKVTFVGTECDNLTQNREYIIQKEDDKNYYIINDKQIKTWYDKGHFKTKEQINEVFKKGNTVTCITNKLEKDMWNKRGITQGKQYIVKNIDGPLIQVINDSGIKEFYHKDFFVLSDCVSHQITSKQNASIKQNLEILKSKLQSNEAEHSLVLDGKKLEITYSVFKPFTLAKITIKNYSEIYGITECIKPDRFSINKGKLYAFKNLVHVLIAMEQSDDYKFYN